jgi:hypothetical protein
MLACPHGTWFPGFSKQQVESECSLILCNTCWPAPGLRVQVGARKTQSESYQAMNYVGD